MDVAGAAAAVAGFLVVGSKFLAAVEVRARGFEDVKARRGCATALRALLAWWLPDRSILWKEKEKEEERISPRVERGKETQLVAARVVEEGHSVSSSQRSAENGQWLPCRRCVYGAVGRSCE